MTPDALATVVAELQRRAAVAEREGATAPVANVYRLVLEELSAVVGAARLPAPEPPGLERYLSPEQVAGLLQVPAAYPYRHRQQLGGVKVGKYLRFPESAVRRRLERSR